MPARMLTPQIVITPPPPVEKRRSDGHGRYYDRETDGMTFSAHLNALLSPRDLPDVTRHYEPCVHRDHLCETAAYTAIIDNLTGRIAVLETLVAELLADKIDRSKKGHNHV